MILPPQMLTKAEKEERHKDTGRNNIEETIDYYISTCNWGQYTSEVLSLYRAVEGHLDQEEYKQLQNPQNKQKPDDAPLQFNAVLKDYNILKGIVNLLMGEFGRRSHEYEVASINPSDEMSYKDGLNILIKDYYSQGIANHLDELGLKLGQTVKEIPTLEEYLAPYKQTFDETRLISGQEVLDYIKYNCDLDNKYIDLYYDWIVSGAAFTYKKVNHDDVYFEIVPRWELFVPNERHSRFIEDYSYAVRRQVLPVMKVLDLFRGRLKKDMLEELESDVTSGLGMQFNDTVMTGVNGAIRLPTLYSNNYSYHNSTNSATNGVELFHVVYTTWRRYGILTYDDGLGEPKTMEVGEDYELNKEQGDISIAYDWENIKYQGYKYKNFYLDCGELVENRADLNQNGLQKLPYNGICERSSTGEIQSIVKEGLPYQRNVNSLKFQVEKMINKNKDKLLVMPYGLIPTKKGINAKTQMYHADATSILWVDETAPNAQLASTMIKAIDMSLGNFIKDAIELIKYNKAEYWESIGMNAQRYADVGANAGKAVTEQAITRSAIITYELTRQFDKLIEKDYQGLLDISKLAYITGKKAKFIRSDSSIGFLNMNEEGAVYHSESSYNVFVRDASMMTEAVQAMRAQAVNLLQNGGDTSVLGKLFQTNNTTKLTKILERMDEKKKEFDMLMQKQKDDAQMAIITKQNETENVISAREKYKADSQYKAAVDSASIRNSNDGEGEIKQPRPTTDLENKLGEHKIEKDNKELELQREALAVKKQGNNNNK